MIEGVLVLAAGKSTRIAGVTGGGPKPLPSGPQASTRSPARRLAKAAVPRPITM